MPQEQTQPYEWNLAGSDDGKQRRGLRPIPLAPCSPFLFWLLLVAVWQYLLLLTRVRCPGHLQSAPPPPNPKLQPRSSGIMNRLVWIEAEAELEEE